MLRSYFRRKLNDRRVMLARIGGDGWRITLRRIVDESDTAEILQTIKKRKGKSVMTTRIALSGDAMQELVYLYENHPDRDKSYEFAMRTSGEGKWELK